MRNVWQRAVMGSRETQRAGLQLASASEWMSSRDAKRASTGNRVKIEQTLLFIQKTLETNSSSQVAAAYTLQTLG